MIIDFTDIVRKAHNKTNDIDKLNALSDTLAYNNRVQNGLLKPNQGRSFEKEVQMSNDHKITIIIDLG